MKANPTLLIQNLGKYIAKEMEKFVKARLRDWRAIWSTVIQKGVPIDKLDDVKRDADKLMKKGEKEIREAIEDAKDSVNDAGKKASNAVKKATKKLGF